MSTVTVRSVCNVVGSRTVFPTTTTSRVAVLRLPGHSHVLARSNSDVIASSSSSPLSPNTDVNMNKGQNALSDARASPFKALGVRVSHGTFKALTVHPFQLEAMTLVQERVTDLLPALACPWGPEGIVSPDIPTPVPPDGKLPVIDWSAPRDILVRVGTGTGKTLAYIIPAIESRLNYVERHARLAVNSATSKRSLHIAESARLAYRRRFAGPTILAPTRELAIQIASDAQKLTTHQRNLEVLLLVRGEGQQSKDWMESSQDLVVATPGQLRDLLANEPEVRKRFEGCPMLILDEVDTLLSMGFRDDIDAIVSFLPRPPVRQTLLFSATMPRAVRQLTSWILSPNHTFIDTTPTELSLASRQDNEHAPPTKFAPPRNTEFTTHNHISQFRILCPTVSDQLPTLLKLLAHDQLSRGSRSKVIIFCPTVQTTQLFSALLRSLVKEALLDDATEVMTMHSKKERSDGNGARVSFRKAGKTQHGRPTILVSSDIGIREVNYPGVTRVIQIGVPSKETIYIHRIGRIARRVMPGKGQDDGAAVRVDLLLLPWEEGYMDWQLTSFPIKPLPISDLDTQLSSLSPHLSTLTTDSLKSAITEAQSSIDSADVRRTAASLLGYYLPLAPALRLQPKGILAGVSSWASDCFNVPIPAITRLPRKFTDAYKRNTQTETKGLFVDGLEIAPGKAKSKNRSVWEGANVQRKRPKRWH